MDFLHSKAVTTFDACSTTLLPHLFSGGPPDSTSRATRNRKNTNFESTIIFVSWIWSKRGWARTATAQSSWNTFSECCGELLRRVRADISHFKIPLFCVLGQKQLSSQTSGTSVSQYSINGFQCGSTCLFWVRTRKITTLSSFLAKLQCFQYFHKSFNIQGSTSHAEGWVEILNIVYSWLVLMPWLVFIGVAENQTQCIWLNRVKTLSTQE